MDKKHLLHSDEEDYHIACRCMFNPCSRHNSTDQQPDSVLLINLTGCNPNAFIFRNICNKSQRSACLENSRDMRAFFILHYNTWWRSLSESKKHNPNQACTPPYYSRVNTFTPTFFSKNDNQIEIWNLSQNHSMLLPSEIRRPAYVENVQLPLLLVHISDAGASVEWLETRCFCGCLFCRKCCEMLSERI